MSKIGFIGYGSMGSMIINEFLSSNVLKQDEIIISNRTKNKLADIKKEYPGIEITENNLDLADKCNVIFLFVSTSAVKEVLKEMEPHLSKNSHIIYISAGLTMETVKSVFQGNVTKVIPSLTSKVHEGVSLVCHDEEVSKDESEFINRLFNAISTVKIVDEEDLEFGSDLTSCSPAFIAEIFSKFAEAGVKNSNFTKEEVDDMIIKTLYGTAKLLHDKNMNFEDVISRVATPGGITEEGIKILDKELSKAFNELFKSTLNKHRAIKEELSGPYQLN